MLEDGTPGDPRPTVRDPIMRLENEMALNEAEGMRQPDSEQYFDRELMETVRNNDHGVPENEMAYNDRDGRALRPSTPDEDVSGMALRSHVGSGTAGANARKLTDVPDYIC